MTENLVNEWISALRPDVVGVLFGILTSFLLAFSAFFAFAKRNSKDEDSLGRLKQGHLKRIAVLEKDLEDRKEQIDVEEAIRVAKLIAQESISDNMIDESLSKYYLNILRQSSTSFYVSVVFGTIGFSVILYASYYFSQDPKNQNVAVFQAIAGVVTTAFSILLLRNTTASRKMLLDSQSKLREDRRILDALSQCDLITDDTQKNKLRTLLVAQFSGLLSPEKKDEAIKMLLGQVPTAQV